MAVLTASGAVSAAIRVVAGDAPQVVLQVSDSRDEKAKSTALDFAQFEEFALGIVAILQKIKATPPVVE